MNSVNSIEFNRMAQCLKNPLQIFLSDGRTAENDSRYYKEIEEKI